MAGASIIVSVLFMSAVIRPKRFKRLPAATPVLWAVLGLAVTFFLVRYGQEVLMEHDLNSKVVVQRTANAKLADENARLEAALQYYQSDKYVEQRAREDLNLRRPDEEVLIPVGDQSQADADTPAQQSRSVAPSGAAAAPTPAPESPNWERWLDLFSPFDNSP
jgi:cell division protein FtsB